MKLEHILGSLLIISVSSTSFAVSDVQKHVADWSKQAKEAASFMEKKYGKPSGMTEDLVVWNNVKPFKRSILYRETVDHNFPMPHKDVLEHFIDYQPPEAQKVAEIWDFDGSVILERTKGEMSARCDKEEANILALNLADQIVKGKSSVVDARMEYGRQILAMNNGSPKELTQKLVFSQISKTGDKDKEMIDSVKKEMRQAQEE